MLIKNKYFLMCAGKTLCKKMYIIGLYILFSDFVLWVRLSVVLLYTYKGICTFAFQIKSQHIIKYLAFVFDHHQQRNVYHILVLLLRVPDLGHGLLDQPKCTSSEKQLRFIFYIWNYELG